jgi:outer membrane lipoprotein-sorting protein
MHKIFRCVAVAGVLAFWSIPAAAQTVDEIIEKHLAATGGRAALSKLTSRSGTGTITLTTPVGDLAGTVEIYAKAPNKSRTLIKLDLSALGAGQVVNDQRFDGVTGYVIDSFNGNREVTGGQLDALRNGIFPSPLLTYKETGTQLTLAPGEKVGAQDAYVVVMTPKTGPSAKLFFDTSSLMLVKTVLTVNVPQLGGDIEQVVEFSDFRDVDGIKLPHVTKATNPAQTVTATITQFTHNASVDDSSFARPAGQ